jgi:recombinational DNA repair ATPase RecF
MSAGVRELVAASLDGSSLGGFERRVAEAAFVGGAELDAVLGGDAAAAEAPGGDAAGASGASAEVWLTGVRVEGFRGVAGEVSLGLPPQPGLVLVVGRNGAGKSSIAEAAELAMSGRSDRSSSALWAEGLVNLHHDGPTRVAVSVRADAGADVVVGRELEGDRLDGSPPSAVRDGAPFDLGSLGWGEAVVRFRPVLTYGELARMSSEKPSALYDPLNRILGLEDLTVADGLLRAAETRLGQPGKDARAGRTALLDALAASDDDRAGPLRIALAGRAPDVAAASALLDDGTVGVVGEDGPVGAWAALGGPDPAAARGAAEALVAAADRRDAAATKEAGRAGRLAGLLSLAVEHREGPEDLCPVCGQGRLDDGWLAQARAETARQEELAAEARQAEDGLAAAARAARALVSAVPAALREPGAGGADPAGALAAWQSWAALADPGLNPRALADRLPAAGSQLAEQLAALRTAAAAELDAHDRQWKPLADDARAVVRDLKAAEAAAPGLAAVKAARAWLKEASEEIRNDRLRPFADQATEIWGALRQDSNVSLSGVTLAGQNTRREVRLDLDVDGEPGPRAVLSQGELAALGLALFLPRAVADESPFRFVLVDDPVQSLDPSKVDGLAKVLHVLADNRQVVVFTHDERLLQSLRHLDLPFTAYRLGRGERSVVTAERVNDPVEQHLRDADALAREADLPPDLLAVAVSGYCRDAIEEAANEVARRRLRADGKTVEETEAAIGAASTTWARLGLALLGDHRPKPKKLNKTLTELGADDELVSRCVEGVHAPDPADLPGLLAKTREFVVALRPPA